jgi:uncharacterized lipoprotein YddW (UPF0748 family)
MSVCGLKEPFKAKTQSRDYTTAHTLEWVDIGRIEEIPPVLDNKRSSKTILGEAWIEILHLTSRGFFDQSMPKELKSLKKRRFF